LTILVKSTDEEVPTKPAKDMRPVDDQSDFLATDARRAGDRCIPETMPVELRDAPDIYGLAPPAA
jgi:hypothetical protein